jgi:transposase
LPVPFWHVPLQSDSYWVESTGREPPARNSFATSFAAIAIETSQHPKSPFIVPLPTSAEPHKVKRSYLTDYEMGEIVNLRGQNLTWLGIADRVGRKKSTCRTFYTNWTETEKFRGTMGRPTSISGTTKTEVIAETEQDCRLGIRDGPAKAKISSESYRIIRHEDGLHYYKTRPIPPLDADDKLERVWSVASDVPARRVFRSFFPMSQWSLKT